MKETKRARYTQKLFTYHITMNIVNGKIRVETPQNIILTYDISMCKLTMHNYPAANSNSMKLLFLRTHILKSAKCTIGQGWPRKLKNMYKHG